MNKCSKPGVTSWHQVGEWRRLRDFMLEESIFNGRERYGYIQCLYPERASRDGFRCVKCGRGREDGVKLHVDHIKPVSRGGKSVLNNLQTLCEDCNCGKGNKYEE